MNSVKLKNIFVSLGILAAWICIIVIVSALSENNGNNISLLYIWARLSGLIAGLGGLVCLALRLFKVIDRHTNFWYTFFTVANSIIGAAAIFFYFHRQINAVGIHDLLPNLLIGVVLVIDLILLKQAS
jgi:hypothetical protein